MSLQIFVQDFLSVLTLAPVQPEISLIETCEHLIALDNMVQKINLQSFVWS